MIRIWVTTLNHGANAQKVYSMIALLTGLEVSLGVINCFLPVMGPILTKFGESKFVSTLSNRLPMYGRSTHGTAISTKRTSIRNHYKTKNGTIFGDFETKIRCSLGPLRVTRLMAHLTQECIHLSRTRQRVLCSVIRLQVRIRHRGHHRRANTTALRES